MQQNREISLASDGRSAPDTKSGALATKLVSAKVSQRKWGSEFHDGFGFILLMINSLGGRLAVRCEPYETAKTAILKSGATVLCISSEQSWPICVATSLQSQLPLDGSSVGTDRGSQKVKVAPSPKRL